MKDRFPRVFLVSNQQQLIVVNYQQAFCQRNLVGGGVVDLSWRGELFVQVFVASTYETLSTRSPPVES